MSAGRLNWSGFLTKKMANHALAFSTKSPSDDILGKHFVSIFLPGSSANQLFYCGLLCLGIISPIGYRGLSRREIKK
jgi:hypothetical protein